MTPEIKPLPFDTYLALIKNSANSRLFRTIYLSVNGKKTDVLHEGQLSCAFFVSSILLMMTSVKNRIKLIKEVHATVQGTIKDLEASGWKKVRNKKAGDILVWENLDFGKAGIHGHIGFYIGGNKALSNKSFDGGMPQAHHWTFGSKKGKPVRRVVAVYRHPLFK